jgi:endonuclease/exonuclease/phosphatase family metal-dependent hydrolase
MRIVTYNIHKARGIDGRTSVKRIAKVLGDLNADIIALQEVFAVCDSFEGQVETLASELDLQPAFGCTRHHRGRPYGNAILSRWPIVESQDVDISWNRREKRGCIRADLKTPRGTLHVFNIHMGTSFFERRHQVRNLLSSKKLDENLSGPRVLVGDFNEWIKGLTTRMLSEKFESLNLELHIRKRRSYPGLLPLLHLDHIYFERPLHIEKAELIRTRLSKIASDHLPLVATFSWGQSAH